MLVTPTLPFGPTPEHVGFGFGFVNLRQSTHEAVFGDMLESLAAQGFETLVVWRGCGQHDLRSVIERFNASHQDCVAYQPVIDYGAASDAALGRQVPGVAVRSHSWARGAGLPGSLCQDWCRLVPFCVQGPDRLAALQRPRREAVPRGVQAAINEARRGGVWRVVLYDWQWQFVQGRRGLLPTYQEAGVAAGVRTQFSLYRSFDGWWGANKTNFLPEFVAWVEEQRSKAA